MIYEKLYRNKAYRLTVVNYAAASINEIKQFKILFP